MGEFGHIVRAQRLKRLPVVLTPEEVPPSLNELEGTWQLLARLIDPVRPAADGRHSTKDQRCRFRNGAIDHSRCQRRERPDDRLAGVASRPAAKRTAARTNRYGSTIVNSSWPESSCRMPWKRNIQMPEKNGRGMGVSRQNNPSARSARSGTIRRHHVLEDGLQRVIKQAIRQAGDPEGGEMLTPC